MAEQCRRTRDGGPATGCAGALHAAARNICKAARDASKEAGDKRGYRAEMDVKPKGQCQTRARATASQKDRASESRRRHGREDRPGSWDNVRHRQVATGRGDGALDVHRSSKVRVLRGQGTGGRRLCCQKDEQGQQLMLLVAGPARCFALALLLVLVLVWREEARSVCGVCSLRSQRR